MPEQRRAAGPLGVMAWAVGPGLFFTVYAVSEALSVGAGILLFTVQHNFEHSSQRPLVAKGELGPCRAKRD